MQRQSPIVLTGLSAEDCAAFGSACSKTGNAWMHMPTALVLASPDLALEAAGQWVLWLYRGPWQLQLGAPAAEEWLAVHRQLLRQRADFGTRLVLVNVDADQPLAVLASLGLTHEVAEMFEPAVSTVGDVGLSAFLAKIFDWAAPDFWDVFEALEASSPATGRLPVFRSALQMPSAEQVPLLHALVVAGAQAPASRAELAAAHQALGQAEAARDALRGDADQLALALRGAEALQAEQAAQLAALRAQLTQQADQLNLGAVALAEQIDAAKETRGELARREPELAEAHARGERLAATVKRRDHSLEQAHAKAAKVQADLTVAQQLAEQGKARAAELESENDLLLLQMRQVQEELEQRYLDSRQQKADADRAQAEQAEQVASLRAELKSRDDSLNQAQAAAGKAQADLAERVGALQQVLSAREQLTQDLQAKTSELAAARQLAEQGKARAAELVSENDLLLLQMRQVQEELEQRYLDSRQQKADADRAQAEQAEQVASLRAELKSRDDSLNQAQAAAGKAQADLAERVESLNEEVQAVQELRGELSRLKPELAEAQARGERLAATLKRRDGSLEQAQAAAAKLQADLAAAQQLAEQCKARAAEIESINDLLLLQVHQPQEELEKFFIENQQLRQVMSQSSQSFDRARRLISRLMLTEREGGLALPLKPVAQTAAAAADVGAAKAA